MRIKLTTRISFLIFCFSLFYDSSTGQVPVLKPSDFLLLSGPGGTGTTLIGSSITINGGSVGAYKLVQTTGNVTINANIYSGDQVILSNSNVVNGNITAANSSGSTNNIVSTGSSLMLTGNIIANGNVNIGGGSIIGSVTIPNGSNYSGPIPTANVLYSGAIQTLLPILPALPTPKIFDPAGSGTITGNTTLIPGSNGMVQSGDVIFSGNKTLTLKGPGIYIFNSFAWTGNSNKLVFNFDNKPGNIYIYVHGNADFGKLNASILNNGGGSASRIYLETHGNGVGTSIPGSSFVIANGSSGGGTKWQGTAYATAAAINIGSGTGSSTVDGAFISPTGITIQSGVTMNFAQFIDCVPPDVNAGGDTPLDFKGEAVLTASSNTQGLTYHWVASEGGIISPNSSPTSQSITVTAKGKYTVTVQKDNAECVGTDEVFVTASVPDIIGSELLFLYKQYIAGTPVESSPFFILQNNYVKIDVVAIDGHLDEVKTLLQTTPYGLINLYPSGLSPLTITGDYPVANLLKLNLLGNIINAVYIYEPPQTGNLSGYTFIDRDLQTGVTKSQGDTTIRTYLVRSGYDIDGDGVKVCILSNSFATINIGTTATLPLQPVTDPPNPIPQTFNTNTFAQDVTNGDLPGAGNPNGYTKNVHILQDFPLTLTDEGRAMAHIVHDVAPGAELYFRTVFFTPGDFAQAIQESYDAGCRVIVDDVIYGNEPFFKDGVVAQKVNEVKNLGASYFTAIGNYSNRSYEFDGFNGVDATAIGFTGKTAHNFATSGPASMFQHVKLKPGNYKIGFQWQDDIYSIGELTGTQYDLDIFVTKFTDGSGLKGYNRNNVLIDPREFIHIIIDPDFPGDTGEKDYYILIINNTPGAGPQRGKYVVFQAPFFQIPNYEGKSTAIAQASAIGAMAVGAVRFNHVPGHPLLPEALSGITKPQLETFSSYGGTWVDGAVRNAPAFSAADGVNTTTKQGQDYPNDALDGYSEFFGTSAAAPHAAAATALIMQGRKKFIALQPDTSPDEVKDLFTSTAVDMRPTGLVGYDFAAGAGLVNADAAMRTIANPKPYEIKLIIPEGVVPCEEPFELTIIGENFNDNSVVYMIIDGVETILTPTFRSDNTIKVLISTCANNPEIKVYTAPKTNFDDGGFSNSLNLFSAQVEVTVQSVTKKYGENMPASFTANVTVNGVPINQTALTLADLGLDGTLVFHTDATKYSDVGTYQLTVTRNFDPLNPADLALLQEYNYKFTNGTVSVGKMGVKVVPDDKTIVFGHALTNITYKYYDDNDNLITDPVLLEKLESSHQQYKPDNVLAVINGYPGSPALTDADLNNLSGMVSFEAVTNGRKFYIDNGVLKPLPQGNTSFDIQYIVDISAQSVINYKANASNSALPLLTPYPGVHKRAMVSAGSLQSGTAEILYNSNLVQMVNGQLVQMINGTSSTYAPILNGTLVQMINGQLVQLINGQPVPIANANLVQMINGQLVQLINGQLVPLANNILVQLINGTLVQMINANLVQMVNGANGLEQQPVLNGNLVQVINGQLVQLINGEPVPNRTLVQMVNGQLVQLVNANLVQMVNGTVLPLTNGLVQIVNGQLVQDVNGTLVQMINGTLVQLINGQLVQLINSFSIGAGNNEGAAVIIDEDDVVEQNGYIGPMFSANIITGLDVGVKKLYSGGLFDNNFSPTYGAGNVTITPASLVITPDAGQSKVYGDADPVLTFTNNLDLTTNDFTGALGRTDGADVGTYAYNIGDLSAGNNYTISLSTATPLPTFQITRRPITIIPTAGQSKIYGSADPATFAFTASEVLQNGDSYSGKLARASGENVGTYAYNIGNLSAGNNYTLILSSALPLATFAITPKPVVITPTSGLNKIYGSSDPVFTYSNNGGLSAGSFTGALGRSAGNNVGLYDYNLGTLSAGSNYMLSLSGTSSKFEIRKATITVTADSKSRQYGESNPAFTYVLSGFKYSDNSSVISGSPVLSTTAVQTSPTGTYPINVNVSGMSASNYQFSGVAGTLTITNNACLLTHAPFKNFGNTPEVPVSMWMNMETKVSGQLTNHGDYLLFTAGTITFNNILPEIVNNMPVPDGKVIAVTGVTEPRTHFDFTNNMWITEIPPGFNSTSDLFVTGVIINSPTGFIKKNGNTSSVLKGIFYSNKNFSDQWAYAMAAYSPQFDYSSIGGPGDVASINGTYRAGTPIPQIGNLVNGGSGGGGNNYTGSTSSFENFSACVSGGGITQRGPITAAPVGETEPGFDELKEIRIMPNPASERVVISYVPKSSGKTRILVMGFDGRKLMEFENGLSEFSKQYFRTIDISKLPGGLYYVQVIVGNSVLTNKLVISR